MTEFSTKKVIDSCNRSDPDQYNILTFATHERYETQLCKTGHNFYSFSVENMKKWNTEQTEIPSNYYILPEGNPCSFIDYDFILSQSKFGQYQVAKQLQKFLKVPIISLEHTVPTPQTIPEDHLAAMRKMVGDINVFISEYSAHQWGIYYNTQIVYHGIDTELFKRKDIEQENHILTVANDFVNRDYCLNYSGWKRITNGLNTKLVGDTKGLSRPAESVEDLVSEYNKCGVYLNTSTLSPIPTSLLEAMSCGCAVVSTATCMIPEIIENGVNGFISNDEQDLREKIEYLLNNKEARLLMGAKARQTIEDKFPEQIFLNKWNEIFNKAYRISHK
jgi:hypothetical protein